MRRSAVAVTAVAALAACMQLVNPPYVDPHVATMVYLDQALDVMEENAYYRRRVPWSLVRAHARGMAENAMKPSDTYAAIRNALSTLQDGHSYFVPASPSNLPGGAQVIGDGSTIAGDPVDSLEYALLDGKYGFIHVPTFSSFSGGPTQTMMADTLQALIKAVDVHSPCGWIVDLRHNRGGNMWPMLAGIGPLLGNDDYVGAFVDADSVRTRWYYENGMAGTIGPTGARNEIARTSGPWYVMKQAGQPIAVLTDSLTVSSGEAITIAFRGLNRVRSFGDSTWGVPTANAAFPLSDGAKIYLMVALDVDRTGKTYDTKIVPDEVIVTGAYPSTDDAVVIAAKNWLATRPGCL